MDRMLLDLNLPPPTCWSPQAQQILSPSSDKRPPSPASSVLETNADNAEELVIVAADPQAGGSQDVDAKIPDAEVSCVTAYPKAQETVVPPDDSGINSEQNNPSTTVSRADQHTTSESREKDSVAKNDDQNRIGFTPVSSGNSVDSDNKLQSGSVSLEANGSNPNDELAADSVRPVKVHKRLRTLGQLTSKKEEKNVVDSSLEDSNLEDEIVSESGGKSRDTAQEPGDGSRRISAKLRSKRGERSGSTLSNNGVAESKEGSSSVAGAKIASRAAKLVKVDPSLSGRFLPRIPSQPRSRKVEKRTSVSSPVVASLLNSDDQHTKPELGEDDKCVVRMKDSDCASPKPQENAALGGDGKADEPEEPLAAPSGNIPAPSSSLKRPGGGLKDSMPGKKRRQTVLLEVDESLKQARPLRNPPGDGLLGRNSRFRRDSPRPLSSQLPEKQEGSCTEGATPSETSRRGEELPEEGVNEKPSKVVSGDGNFRRPGLKRVPSMNSTREDTGGKYLSTSQDWNLSKGSNVDALKNTGNMSESSIQQKPRRFLRKTEANKTVTVQDASIERLHREATSSKLWQTCGLCSACVLILPSVPVDHVDYDGFAKLLAFYSLTYLGSDTSFFHGLSFSVSFLMGEANVPGTIATANSKSCPLVEDVRFSSLTGGTSDLQKVPGSFESVEDYTRVLEPLLFEECRAQLHSSWEELLEGNVKDAHIPVSIKGVERRERGWFDVIILPEDPHVKLKFKEGDVAVVSTPKPGNGNRQKGRGKGFSYKEKEDGVITGRLTGIIRRYYPIDVRDPPGAVVHFHVSLEDAEDVSGVDPSAVNGNVMKEFSRPGLTWFLTVLGSVTTTQREYVALHFLQQFHPKMLNAILQPRPELFPGYADQEPPAMPECFTPAFVEHLHGHFNAPQLAAIQWAGAHTAAGSGSSAASGAPKQEPWPFTLVQGPPGTGKTHTVWGMLNVIHLVQYQRYYQALLKKLAPNSLATEETSTSSHGSFENGSIDDVLQRMDDSLARMLPKLCPKPRMLVCAPSNAATDELLARVLDRGFIDGEMKVYRPDVARVGSDPLSRAAQAVSVERRSEQLLAMGRDQIVGWLQQLKSKEINCSQIITGLQRDLNEVAAAARAQGNLGVDPDKLAARDQARDSKLQQLAALVEERDKILVEMSRLLIVEGRFRLGTGFSHDEARQKLEASFANEAEIVFTTVSSSGRRIFTKLAHGFDMVVIDEAAQASEVAVLPPLSLRAARCVLVGDPQQLPATVISRVADTMQYSRSLFERFQQAGCPAILLSVQYRMHPQIRDFPSRYFYQGRLVDSESVRSRPDEAYHKDSLLQPYLFYDISHGRESHGGSVSYQNKLEAQVAVRLYRHLQEVVAAGGLPSVSVGMITPYKQQLRCLQTEFEAVVGVNAESKAVYINTVDAFQGQERDVIMMSCVRASTHGVGFVADIRRMNVALTRARRALWVIGNAAALVQSEDWAALIADAKARGCFVDTAASISKGLLNEPPGVMVPPHAGSLRPSLQPSPQYGMGNLDHSSSVRDRQQESGIVHHGSEAEQRGVWQGSAYRGGRAHRDTSRGGFSQRGLPPCRSHGRGVNLSYRRGKGL
ncbi:hypothetical protein R1sor_000002 [Riccia sorocarpa]|uniref:Uncharacterized protein n=1 Tax=Riccia sorocarpa TaxID=122646 RepID=A0ABD3GV19_9MARC